MKPDWKMRRRNSTFFRFLFAVFLTAGLLLGSVAQAAEPETWAVYWYICGSDLESGLKRASENIRELCSVQLPENVKVIIQTGGAKQWHLEGIPSDALGRYIYDSTGFHEIERLPDASMGSGETLQDFLRFATEKYPADHRVLVLWDHGIGSLGGVCLDERYKEIIGLNALQNALAGSLKQDAVHPPLDLVCFDACVMATLETANSLYGFTRYMAASQDSVPGHGFDYAGWVEALAKNPSMDGGKLGKMIGDTYFAQCAAKDTQDTATFSVLDFSALPRLNATYERMGKEALQKSKADPRYFFTALDRVANDVEHYGNYEMVDLGSLAEKMEGVKSADAVARAVDRAVIYRLGGKYRRYGKGLSAYYVLSGRKETCETYSNLAVANDTIASLYSTMLAGGTDGKPWSAFDVSKVPEIPVSLDAENIATATLPPDVLNAVSKGSFAIYLPAGDKLLFLGSDDKIAVDWKKGVFRDGYDGKWPALNGHLLPMQLHEQHPDYNLYITLIKLNGEKHLLWLAFDIEKNTFEIPGARRILQDKTLDRDLVKLHAGDTVTPIFVSADGKTQVDGDPFTLDKEPVLQDEPLPDGEYVFMFRFETLHNEYFGSKPVKFTLENGELKMETLSAQ